MNINPQLTFDIKASKREVISRLQEIVNSKGYGHWNWYKGSIDNDRFRIRRDYSTVYNLSFNKKLGSTPEKIRGGGNTMMDGTISGYMGLTSINVSAKLGKFVHFFMLLMAVAPFIFVYAVGGITFSIEEFIKVFGILCLPIILIIYLIQFLSCRRELKILKKDIEGLFNEQSAINFQENN